uniref:Probable transcription termination protein NusA n=1 Tax=Fervidicoccus fontis TaxID=683846 RepID=A0A7J3ZKK9_9CREN
MPEIRLTPEELRYIALFQDVTGATVKDCILLDNENAVIFIVKKGDMGLAIGRKGANVKKLRKILGKDIKIVEDGETVEDLAINCVAPARVRGVKVVEISGKKRVYISVDPKDKGIAIGKNGKTIARTKLILRRYFDVDDVIIV